MSPLRRPGYVPAEVVACPVNLVAMPTTCKATFALMMSCGHIQFGCSDSGWEPLMARLTLERKETITCALCVKPSGRAQRSIEWVWDVE